MNMRKGAAARSAALTALTVFAVSLLSEPAGSVSRGGAFLPLGWDARGTGLAGAATILVRDDRSAYWNPANITYILNPSMSIGTTKPVPGLENRYSILSIGAGLMGTLSGPDEEEPSMRRLGVALSVTHLGLELAAGSRWSESSFGISAAIAPNHYNSLGITLRYLKSWSDLEDADSRGAAIDIGWSAVLLEGFRVGLVGRNVFSSISYPDREEEIDAAYNLALAYERFLDRISAELDAVAKKGELDRILAGTELTLFEDLLFVLAGADFRLRSGKRTIYHLGFETRYMKSEISISFAFDPEDAFERQTRLSVSLRPWD